MNNHQKEQFKVIQGLAIERGYEVLSKEYLGAHLHMRFRCKVDNYEWSSMPTNFKGRPSQKGSGCPKCAGNKKKYKEDMQHFSSSRGREFSSESYFNQ